MVKVLFFFGIFMATAVSAQYQVGWAISGASGFSNGKVRPGSDVSFIRAFPLALGTGWSPELWIKKGNHGISFSGLFSNSQNRFDYQNVQNQPLGTFMIESRLRQMGVLWRYMPKDSIIYIGPKPFFSLGFFRSIRHVFANDVFLHQTPQEIFTLNLPKINPLNSVLLKAGVSIPIASGVFLQTGLWGNVMLNPPAYVSAELKNLQVPGNLIKNEVQWRHGMVGLFLQWDIKSADIKAKNKGSDSLMNIGNMKLNDAFIPIELLGRKVVHQGQIRMEKSQVEFVIYDAGFVDGDSISLNMNGKWILENYALTAEKKKIQIQLSPGQNNYLVMYALNLGKDPPNTAAISYFENGSEIRLQIKSSLLECGAINFYVP